MPVDLNDPAMEGYVPLEEIVVEDNDESSFNIRDIPFGRLKESMRIFPDPINVLNCGNITVGQTSTPQTIIVHNDGYGKLLITQIHVVGSFDLVPTTLTEIEAGESASIQVTFSPKRVNTHTGGVYFNAGRVVGRNFIRLLGVGVA